MSAHLFKSFTSCKPVEAPTPDDLATDLALEMIDRIKERRALAQQKDATCDAAEPWLQADAEAYHTLETLLAGRHRQTVLWLLFEHFPELVAKMKVNN